MLEYILAGIAVIVIIAALSYFMKFNKKSTPQTHNVEQKGAVCCPMCGSSLQKGQDIYTRVWRPLTVSDQRIIITGCPHCSPSCEPGVKRVCPVCKKSISAEGHLVAHLFNMPQGRHHIVVTGCSQCCKYEKNR